MPGSPASSAVEAQLGRLLLRGNRTFLYDAITRDVDGVDPTTYPVLSGLARLGPSTATDLAEAIGLDRGACSRYLSRLQSAGLVARLPHGTDGRAVRVELTPAGTTAVAALRGALTAVLDDVLAPWPAGGAERFAADLERFADALARMRDEHAGTGAR